MQNILSLTYEFKRLKTLLSYHILDTPGEREFDNLVKIAAHIFNVPVAAVTFIDENRQWIKASVGLTVCETDRREAVCNYTIRHETINEIEDMRKDDRFSHFPFVAGAPFFRFYAGAPLITENNYRIGALCIMDTNARTLNHEEKELLSALSNVAMVQVEISLRIKEVEKINQLHKKIALLLTKTSGTENAANEVLNTENLTALADLLNRQADYIVCLVQDKKRCKEVELQQAIDRIENEALKQVVKNIVSEVGSAVDTKG